MPYTAQDLVAQARAVIEEIDSERLRAPQPPPPAAIPSTSPSASASSS